MQECIHRGLFSRELLEPWHSEGLPNREWRMTPLASFSPQAGGVASNACPSTAHRERELREQRCGMTGPCKRAHLKMEPLQLSQETAS